MIDIHSHILPGVDDGSKNLDESLGLLKLLAEQGVTHSIATPHFYADCDTPERFFIRREDAWQKLHPALTPELPSVSLGAEVYYYRGISQMEQLRQFCIENSDFLLLEMPFEPWKPYMVDEAVEIAESGIAVILAHVERYFSMQPRQTWKALSERGLYMQCNADSLLHWQTAHRLRKMLRQGSIQFLGSDCHNLRSRRPHLGEAAASMGKRLGAEFTAEFFRAEEALLWQEVRQ